MEYPRMVYISPGQNKCAEGSFDCEPVKNEKEHKAALDAGLSDSVPDALKSAQAEKESIKLSNAKVVRSSTVKEVKK
jgi:hypothetical protein